jgi:glycogen(starch) synthase
MKVLMTADAVGGVWTYAQDLTGALASRGVEILVAVMGPRPSVKQLEEWRRLSPVEVVHGAYELEWMQRPWFDVDRAGAWLLQLAEEFQPDVVHLNGYAHAALPWHAPRLIVAHSCVLTWWRAVHHEPAPPEWNTYRERIAAGLRAADHLVTPTLAFLSQLQTQYEDLPSASVIHNGRGAETFPGNPAEHGSFIFGAGRVWDRSKNIATLDRAAKTLAWPVYIAGDADSFGQQQTLSHAHALGRLEAPELRHWLRRAGIFASSALYEPFGLGVLEAALSRCALVLSDIATFRELWSGAAVFVDPQDSHAWQSALRDLIADPARTTQLADAARKRAVEFSAERMASAYLGLYRRLSRFSQSIVPAFPAIHSSCTDRHA